MPALVEEDDDEEGADWLLCSAELEPGHLERGDARLRGGGSRMRSCMVLTANGNAGDRCGEKKIESDRRHKKASGARVICICASVEQGGLMCATMSLF